MTDRPGRRQAVERRQAAGKEVAKAVAKEKAKMGKARAKEKAKARARASLALSPGSWLSIHLQAPMVLL